MCLRRQPWARGHLCRGLRLYRLFFLHFRFTMPNGAADSCADHGMVPCEMTDRATNDSTFNAATRVGNDRQRRSGNRQDNDQEYFLHA